jgi:hypothetical protein
MSEFPTTRLQTELYTAQISRWPASGRHILAQFDDEHVVVYQAYQPSIGQYAARQGHLGGPNFSLNRMSWIKPNFLWMMFRSGWGAKEGQEVVLALWLRRACFDDLLRQAVHSTFVPGIYTDHTDWQQAVATSSVRLQWDPDHHPAGGKVERRAIQLGLRGEVLRQFAQGGWIEHIEDISAFVAGQRPHANPPYLHLLTPHEVVYPAPDNETRRRLQLDTV